VFLHQAVSRKRRRRIHDRYCASHAISFLI
jgi:hypothetical protein